MTNPIGLVKNASAAPNAVVTVVAIPATSFHAVVATFIAIVAVVSAIFNPVLITNWAACLINAAVPLIKDIIKSFAYKAVK